MQLTSMPREELFRVVLNVPALLPGTRLTRPGHMNTPVCAVLYHRGQIRELATLIALSGGLFQ